jgi:hypothetical protein
MVTSIMVYGKYIAIRHHPYHKHDTQNFLKSELMQMIKISTANLTTKLQGQWDMMQCWCLYKTSDGYQEVLYIWKDSGTNSIQEDVLGTAIIRWGETAYLTKTGSQIEKLVLFCESHIRKKLIN